MNVLNGSRSLLLLIITCWLLAAFGARISSAHAVTTAPPVPQTTTTPLPPIDPSTPAGSPVPVGDPLPTASLSEHAITAANAHALVQLTAEEPADLWGEGPVGFTRDGTRLVTERRVDNAASRFHLRSLPTGEVLADMGPASSSFGERLISPDGTLLATSNDLADGHVVLRDMMTGEHLRVFRGGQQVRGLGFLDSGRSIASIRADHHLTIWDVASGRLEVLRKLSNSFDCCPVMAIHPGGTELAVGVENRVLRIDANDGTTLATQKIDPNETVQWLGFRPDGTALAVLASQGESFSASVPFHAYLIEGEQKRRVFTFESRAFLPRAGWSRDGAHLAVRAAEYAGGSPRQESIVVWSAGRERVQEHRPPEDVQIGTLTWSSAGPLLAYDVWRRGETPSATVLIDVIAAAEVARVEHVIEPRFSPDGSLLVVKGDRVDGRALRILSVDPEHEMPPNSSTLLLPFIQVNPIP